MSRLLTFIKKNWLAIAGLLLGVLGIGLSVYFYLLSVAEREPVFLVDPVKTTIVDTKSFSNSTLKVVKDNNVPINSDVASIRFYFWNNGKLSIKPENVLQPITLSLSDPNAEILDFRILKASRPDIVRPVLKRSDANPTQALLLSFDILETNDGMTCQIIFSGNTQVDLVSSGTIEGVTQIKTNAVLSNTQYYRRDMPKNVGWGILGLAFLILMNVLGNWAGTRLSDWWVSAKQSPSRIKRWFYRTIVYANILLMILCVVVMIYAYIVSPIYKAKEQSNTSIVGLVPPSIKP